MFIIMCCIFVIVGILFVSDVRNKGVPLSQKEKTTALTKLLGRTPVLEEKKAENTWISHENQYVSFLYPKSALVYAKENQIAMQEKSILDSFHFATDTPRVYVAVQVLARPELVSLSDFPAVLARQQQTEIYIKEQETVDSKSAEVFVKDSNPCEQSAFFSTGGNVYSIVVTGENSEDVSAFFNRFTSSFRVF